MNIWRELFSFNRSDTMLMTLIMISFSNLSYSHWRLLNFHSNLKIKYWQRIQTVNKVKLTYNQSHLTHQYKWRCQLSKIRERRREITETEAEKLWIYRRQVKLKFKYIIQHQSLYQTLLHSLCNLTKTAVHFSISFRKSYRY